MPAYHEKWDLALATAFVPVDHHWDAKPKVEATPEDVMLSMVNLVCPPKSLQHILIPHVSKTMASKQDSRLIVKEVANPLTQRDHWPPNAYDSHGPLLLDRQGKGLYVNGKAQPGSALEYAMDVPTSIAAAVLCTGNLSQEVRCESLRGNNSQHAYI